MKIQPAPLLPLLVMLAIFPGAYSAKPFGTDVCQGRPCLQIGSFNIEYLGGTRRRGEETLAPRSNRTLKKLAKLINKKLDLELVVLQEINTESRAWERLSSLLAARGYRFIAGHHSNRQQFVVIAYDADEIELIGEDAGELDGFPTSFEQPGTECQVGGQRRPVAGRFKAGDFDFWLVGVHLKSKSTYGIPADCPDWVRGEQARHLLTEVSRLSQSSNEPDVILAGDFNAEFNEPSLAAFRDAGFQSLMMPSFKNQRSGEFSYRKGYKSVIDHVMIRPDITEGFVPRTAFIYPLPEQRLEEYIEKISDHVPVWGSFFQGF